KTINVFNEESKFLIWRPVKFDDYKGWLILRCMTLEQRESIIKEIGDDKIIPVPVEKDGCVYDALVTVTTMKAQQEKSYYQSNSLQDCCLLPGEKIDMMFELLNTSNKTNANIDTKTDTDAKIDTSVDTKTETKSNSGNNYSNTNNCVDCCHNSI